ncbi:MAG: hypothetical protein HUJ29_05410 [Gammaproteobacteria bacterium]|nr:hypothetical protein [Gammaproteobacteria bacterium]
MNIFDTSKRMMRILLIAFMVSSCEPVTLASGGIGGTGISWGTIAAFGSVYVNGVHFDTDNIEEVQVNGITYSDLSALRVGMVVRIYGSINADGITGTARGILYENELTGPISSVDDAGDTISVLGQTVHVDGNTLYTNNADSAVILNEADLDPLSGTTYEIEVSGYSNGNGEIYARRIELKDIWTDPGEVEFKGSIDTISGNSLTIGTLTVDISAIATDLEFTPSTGMYVKVKGSYSSITPNTVIASDVEQRELGVAGTDGEEYELEGVITSNGGGGLITINGQSVNVGSAQYENGDSSLLSPGTYIEVEGVFDAAGVLIADEVEFESVGGETESVGSISTVNSTTRTITINGLSIYVPFTAIMKDDRETALDEYLNMEELSSIVQSLGNANAEVRYYDDNGVNTATRVILKD